MKKLITIMAAAASALFAFGDVTLPSGTSLEDLTAGEALDPTKNDDGTGSDNTYWYLTGDDQADLLVTNYEGGVTLPTRPAQFAEQTNDNYLKIDTQGRLYRSIGANDQTGEAFPTIGISDGIYLDTLVQFTAADDEFKGDAITDGDKIAIEYVEHEADETTGEAGYTNFVVRAGYVSGSSIVATNYFLTLPGQAANEVQFDKTAWHRLTVRAISNVGNAIAPVGFVVYVDGTNLVYGVDVPAGDETYVGSLNSVVKTYLYNENAHALLPSLLRYGETGYDTLSAVAFNGNGCVDDISFTATQPTFIHEGTTVTIAWDANVATYTVVVGQTTLINAEAVSGAGSTNLLLDTEITAITVTATYATGYEAGTWTVSGSGAAISGSTFTVAPGARLDIVSMRPLFEVDGVKYGSFQDAIGAAVAASKTTDPWTSVTIKALANIDEAISFADGDIVLDLNGKTLQGTIEEYTINNSGAILTIIDSASGGRVLAPSGEDSTGALYMDNGATVINAGRFEGNVITQKMDEGDGADDLTLNGGVFADSLYNPADPEAKFYLYDYLGTGVEATYNAGYFTVGTPAPEPTVVQIPAALLGIVYDGSLKTGVVEQVGFTLSGNTAVNAGSYTATATLDQDCVWSDETTAPKEINWSIAADTSATVDVTFSPAIAEYSAQLEFPTATASVGNEAVLGTATWDPATITEPSAGATNDYTVTFMVTNGNYTGSTGTATFKVYKAAGGGYPSYIPTEDAEVKAKYDAWATKYGADTTSAHEDAFLLNCAPADVDTEKAAFKLNITIVGDTVTVTGPDGKTYNGTVQLKGSNDLSTWTNVESASKSYQFFKAVLAL